MTTEESLEQPEAEEPAVTEENKPDPDSAEGLVIRLTAIRERLFWLAAVYATTLSSDVAIEADAYRKLFRELGERLKTIDAQSYEKLVAGHEALLLSDPGPVKGKIPLQLQERVELIWELQARPKPQPTQTPPNHIPDGLQCLL